MKICNIGRVVVGVGCAKSGTWFSMNTTGEKRTHLFSVAVVENDESKALSIIVLPFSIMLGYVSLKK